MSDWGYSYLGPYAPPSAAGAPDIDIMELLGSMPEEEQQYWLGQLGIYDTYGATDAYAPSLDAASAYLGGMTPVLPDYNSKGEMLPFGSDQMAQLLTMQKNRNALMADNVSAAMGGIGAYDTSAFQPTMTYEGPVLQQPGRQALGFYNTGGNDYQSLIAENLMAGDTPAQAVGKLIQLINLPDDGTIDPALKAQRDELVASLEPAKYDALQALEGIGEDKRTPAQKAASQYDVQALYDFANEQGQGLATDPQGGYTDPRTGISYANAPTETWSEAAQWYRDRGLPFPTEQYTDPKYTQPVDNALYDQAYAEQMGAASDIAARGPGWDVIRQMEDALLAEKGPGLMRGLEGTLSKMPGLQGVSPFGGPEAGPNSYGYVNGVKTPMRPGTGQVPVSYRYVNGVLTPSYAVGEGGTTAGVSPIASYLTQGAGGDYSLTTKPVDKETGMQTSTLGGGYTGQVAPGAFGGPVTTAPSSQKVTQALVDRYKRNQESARRARSAGLDTRIAQSEAERQWVGRMGQAQAVQRMGHTPLADVLAKRALVMKQMGMG